MQDRIRAAYEEVLTAYEALGYPRAIVDTWAISHNDVEPLGRLLLDAAPSTILEVGTYVGVSTLLMAMLAPAARIVTVDPNFPLNVEMGAVGSPLGDVDATLKTQELGRRAARLLGCDDRIKWVQGGFSVGETFSSVLSDPGRRVRVVGPRVCRQDGPFDFVFIDGLHTAEAVAKDLALSSTALTEAGVMTLHDTVGFWGSNVRAGVSQFLEDHPEFRFTHPPYERVYESVGLVRRRSSARWNYEAVRKPLNGADSTADVGAPLATIAASMLGTEGLVEISVDAPVVKPVLEQQGASIRNVPTKAKGRRADAAGAVKRLRELSDIRGVVSLEFLDFADDEAVGALLATLGERSVPAFLCGTPPGERGITGPESRPLSRVVALAEAAGLSVFAVSGLDLEPSRYAMLPQARPLSSSSLLNNTLVVSASATFADTAGRALPPLTRELAREREQADLYRVHLGQGYRRTFEREQLSSELVQRVQARMAELEAEHRDQISSLESRAAEASAARGQSDLAIQQAAQHAANLQQELETVRGTLATLGAERDGLRESRDDLEVRLAEARGVESALRNEGARLAREEELARGRLEEMIARAAEAQGAAQQLRDALQAAEARLEQERVQALAMHNQLGDAVGSARELRDRVNEQQALRVQHDQAFAAWRQGAVEAELRLQAELTQLRQSQDAEREATLARDAEVRRIHAEQSAILQDAMDAANRAALAREEELRRLHAEQIAAFQAGNEATRQDAAAREAELRRAHEQELAALRETIDVANRAAVAREDELRRLHGEQIATFQQSVDTLRDEAAARERDLMQAHGAELAGVRHALETARAEALAREEALKRSHSESVGLLRAENDQLLQRLDERLESQLRDWREREAVQAARSAEVAAREAELREEHRREREALTAAWEQRLATATLEATRLQDELRATLSAAQAEARRREVELLERQADERHALSREFSARLDAARDDARQETGRELAQAREQFRLEWERLTTTAEQQHRDLEARYARERETLETRLADVVADGQALRTKLEARHAEALNEVAAQTDAAVQAAEALRAELEAQASARAEVTEQLERIQAALSAEVEARLSDGQSGALQLAETAAREERLAAEALHLREELARHQAERDALLRSASWRVTSPIRRVLGAFRR